MRDEFRFSADLPPFSGLNTPCPKCRGEIATTYHTTWRSPDILEKGPSWPCGKRPHVNDRHLCRVCRSCGYGWCEATADAPETADA